ncbi:hypothetical protein DT070_02040 [Polaromonas sp. SP1]|nr:hypothetical protein DT070_02040 [Polaromonas sp. SP1]QGJ18231.1 hypothetical protein F7R28_07385 [Polaromonas sp. Pch-P]
MPNNSKQTSGRIATLASETLQDNQSSKISRSLAASALSQRNTSHQTGAEMEDLASRALRNERSSETTRELAASVLSQANKKR